MKALKTLVVPKARDTSIIEVEEEVATRLKGAIDGGETMDGKAARGATIEGASIQRA